MVVLKDMVLLKLTTLGCIDLLKQINELIRDSREEVCVLTKLYSLDYLTSTHASTLLCQTRLMGYYSSPITSQKFLWTRLVDNVHKTRWLKSMGHYIKWSLSNYITIVTLVWWWHCLSCNTHEDFTHVKHGVDLP